MTAMGQACPEKWRGWTGRLGAVWGLGGVCGLLGFALFRLTLRALEGLAHEFTWLHWIVLAATVILMGWAEGYRGFQRRFSPRVAARARYVAAHPTLARVLAAPLFCMAFFHAPRRRQVVSITFTLGLIALVILLRQVPQPWRGIVDAGVVFGLAWGLASVVVFGVRALRAPEFPHSPEVPSGLPGRTLGGRV